MKRKSNRILSALVCIAMMLSLLPTSVFAADNAHTAHSSYVVHVEAAEGNCTTPGNTEFWYCDYYTCRKYYADEAMTQEIAPADAIRTPGAHSEACDNCGYTKKEMTFQHFVPAWQPEYDEEFYFWSNGGFYRMFAERLEGSTFLFVGEGSDGRLYAMGNETNPDGSRKAVDITDKVREDGSVTVDSDAVEFFSFKNMQETYTFSPDNGYMTVMDGKIVVCGQNVEAQKEALDLPQTIRFEQDKELANYTEEKGYLFSWDLNSGLILFDDSGEQARFSAVDSWTDAGDTRVHNIMLYEAGCEHAHLEHTAAVAETCTDDGNVEYWYCGNCNKYFADAAGNNKLSEIRIPATDHDWEEWTVVTPATQEADGVKQRVCKNDRTHVEEQSYHFTTHMPAQQASCTECGRIEYWYCEICYQNFATAEESHELYEEMLTARATGHSFNDQGICENCTLKRNVYTQVSTLEQFDGLSEDAYYLIVFKDGDKTYAARLMEENPYWADWDHNYEWDLLEQDDNENGIPDCIETADLDENGVPDYTEDQDYDEIPGTYNDYYRIYDALGCAKDEELYATSNFVEVTVAEDGSITVTDEKAMEVQMMNSGVWGGQWYDDERLAYEKEEYGIQDNDRLRAMWVPNYWVASDGMMGSYGESQFMIQNRRYGDHEYPGITDNKNWKISFNEDGTVLLVCSWTEFEDSAALQLAKYTNENGEADMTIVGLPEWQWEYSEIMQNRTALLPAYLYASEAVYAVPPHTCEFGPWVKDEVAETHTRVCLDPECGKTETQRHGWDSGKVTKEPACEAAGEKLYTCADCGATKTEILEALEHDWTPWTDDGENADTHSCTCSRNCGAAPKQENHRWGAWVADGENGHKKVCSVCGGFRTDVHHWDAGKVTLEPTEDAEGIKTYTCADCGHTKTETIQKLEHVHGWSEWSANGEESHTRTCRCGEAQTEDHVFDDGVVINWATHLAPGEIHYTCATCGYVKIGTQPPLEEHEWSDWKEDGKEHMRTCLCGAVETLPHNWGAWIPAATAADSYQRMCTDCEAAEWMTIDPEIPVNATPEGNAGNTNLTNPDIELIDKILTDDEQSKVAEGAQVKVYLKVEDVSENVREEERTAAQSAAGESEIGLYLDIDLFKQVDTEETQVTETAGTVTITITIPEELINTDESVQRTYRIIRVHETENGELVVDVIEGVFDPESNTFTFETDKFSTYALAYADEGAGVLCDYNGDGEVTDADAIYLLRHTLFAEDYPISQSGDVNKDGEVTDADAIYLLRYTLFPEDYPLV